MRYHGVYPSLYLPGKFISDIWNSETSKAEFLGGDFPTAEAAAHAYNQRAAELGMPLNVIDSDGDDDEYGGNDSAGSDGSGDGGEGEGQGAFFAAGSSTDAAASSHSAAQGAANSEIELPTASATEVASEGTLTSR